ERVELEEQRFRLAQAAIGAEGSLVAERHQPALTGRLAPTGVAEGESRYGEIGQEIDPGQAGIAHGARIPQLIKGLQRRSRALHHVLDAHSPARYGRVDAERFLLRSVTRMPWDVSGPAARGTALYLTAFECAIGELAGARLRQTLLCDHLDKALVRR